MKRRAVIMAGGKGTRLRPYTMLLPKPLMPLGDRAILEIILRQLSVAGFQRVTLAVNHQANILMAYFGDGSKWSIEIDYSVENEPLGTMGPLKLIHDLPDNFLVMNGDVLTDIDYAQFFASHVDNKRLMSISAAKREQLIDYGVLKLDALGKLHSFEEKPRIPYLVSMGVYCLSRELVKRIPENRSFGFDDLVLSLLESNEPAHVVEHNGYWLDIGRPDDYQKATDDWPKLSLELTASGLLDG